MRKRFRRGARLRSSGRLFNEWIEKSRADLALLTTELPTGPYPYAGIPWFSTAFGRDAIITALQMLWIDPSIARGVLRYLAQHQAKETSVFQDAEPGKIMHETRKGEMTSLRELPFGQYYGGVDTTPLFVMLAVSYADRTGDLGLIDELWGSLEAAMGWIESASATHRQGFLSYQRNLGNGLVNQGWKDSDDSIFHADGRLAEGPIALIEVQGYVFAAFQGMSGLATRRGDLARARIWKSRAARLRSKVETHFWVEDLGFYGIAIDGAGDLCRVRASNMGHALFVGLPDTVRAQAATRHLLSGAFDTGWGLRTVAAGQAHFNPMSYHNGSVWPHDTALCAAGIARYGERDGIVRLTNEMFEASVQFGMRVPELFCGFPRAPSEPPIAYPVACVPQAWAAGSVFMLLQALLGLRIDGWKKEIHVDRPRLPIGIDQLAVHGLSVGEHCVDLTFQTLGERVVAFSNGGTPSPVQLMLHL
jgi:glycogen debranching enzyme